MPEILALDPAIVVGARVSRLLDGRVGTVTRVLDREGVRSGLVEIRWDGQTRPSRSSGFELGDEIRALS
jgi:hypothetical protein